MSRRSCVLSRTSLLGACRAAAQVLNPRVVHITLKHVPAVDGIVYASSITGEACCALDVQNENCVDAKAATSGTGPVRLLMIQTS
jgi:hypothetical protein